MATKGTIIVNVSGGVDSTACYLLALERGLPFRAVFADVGNEHEVTLEYISDLARITGGPQVETFRANFRQNMAVRRMNLELMLQSGSFIRGWERQGVVHVLENLHTSGNPFLDLCMTKGRFPSTKARFCTTELKMNVLTNQIIAPAIAESVAQGRTARDVFSWVGIRRDESPNRSDAEEWEIGKIGSVIYRPLVDWKKSDCFDLLKRHGVPPNPLYKLGCGRVGCMPCIHAGKDEIREIAKRWPEHIDKIRDWERMVSACSKCQKSTFFSADKTPGKHDGRSNIDSVVEWSMTGHGGRQFDILKLLEEPAACSSKYGLCE